MQDSPIDFVIFWVDDTDPAWREAFLAARRKAGEGDDASTIRVRCWHNLHYWFRAVERFAPWVRRVHLVTWGHLPAWLEREHPRLRIVNHRDFIPAEYLPTFNSLTIGLNLHRIGGLSEQFVVFNDDMFLTRACRPGDFFRRGLPCDMARLSVVQPSSIGHIIYNDLELINAKWRKNSVIRAHLAKWLHPGYGIGNLLKTLTLLPWSMFTGMLDHHVPQPYLRSHCDRCWAEWGGGARRHLPPHVPPSEQRVGLSLPLRHAGRRGLHPARYGRLPADDPGRRHDRGDLPRHREAAVADDLPERRRANRRFRGRARPAQRCVPAASARKVEL